MLRYGTVVAVLVNWKTPWALRPVVDETTALVLVVFAVLIYVYQSPARLLASIVIGLCHV
jgi:hypothetical protein